MASLTPAGGAAAPPFAQSARLLAFAVLLVAATALFVNLTHPYQMDFASYWAAAILTLQGTPAAAYDIAAHHAVQQQAGAFGATMPFPYPPPFLLVVLPFGLLPYGVAAIAWVAATFAAYLTAIRRLFPDAGWLPAAFPAVLVNAIIGQNGLLTAALFVTGALLLPKRPFLAGLLFGLLIIKPQLGVLLPLAFVAGREWRAFAGATVGAGGALLAALLLLGPAPYATMTELMPLYGSIARDGLVPWHKMASLYAALGMTGLPAAIALTAHAFAALAGAAAIWRIWRRPGGDPLGKAAALAAASLLVSPYLYGYDMLILIVPLLWLLGRGENRALLAVLWCLPLVSLFQDWGLLPAIVNPLPFVSLTLLWLVYRRVMAGDSAPSALISLRHRID